MAYASKSNSKSRGQLNLKPSRPIISAYRFSSIAKNITIWIIIAAAIAVFSAVIASVLLTPERRAHSDLESLARDYYENVFYPKSLNNIDDPAQVFSRYETTGFNPVNLRQLSLLGTGNVSADYLLELCDEEATSVIYYPEPPYSRTSYHIDYTYSCNF